MPQSESTAATAAWAEELAERLTAQRDRLREAAAAQREKASQWEKNLQDQLAAIQQELQAVADDGELRDSEVAQKLALLKSEQECCTLQGADLTRHRGELDSLRQTLESTQQASLARQQSLLDEVTRGLAQLQQRGAALADQQAQSAAAQAEVEARRRACDDAQRLLSEREESLLAREAELNRQGETCRERDLALSQREDALHQREASLDQRDAALHQRDETLRGREAAIGQRSDAMRDAERAITEQEAQLAQRENELKLTAQRTRSQRTAAAQQLRARRKEFLAEMERQQAEAVRVAAGDDAALVEQLQELRREIVRLKDSEESQAETQLAVEEQLEQAKKELLGLHRQLQEAEARPAGESGGADSDELRQRLEMALTDVRELKDRNAELSDQLAKSKSAGPAVAVLGGGGDDWESRKQRMLAQLESDFDERDPQQKASKLTIEQAIQRTEEAMAAKSEEILELQRLLSQQSGNIGGVAIGASAIAEMLDTDELVRQERENLRELQEKLREQLKQAEIDLSVERAKVARERALLEEKSREFAQRQQQPGGSDDSPLPAGGKAKQGSNRGRWLQRLGLRDEDPK